MRLIDAEEVIKAIDRHTFDTVDGLCLDEDITIILEEVPTAQPGIIRCKDCRWWDKYDDNIGYCHAAKHGYWSEHWDISIRRVYRGDFYCADAERGGEDEETKYV